MATHPSVLAWRSSWTEEPGRQQSVWAQQVGHDWATNTFTFFSCTYLSIIFHLSILLSATSISDINPSIHYLPIHLPSITYNWRRAWHPTPVFLPGEAHGQRSLVTTVPGAARVGPDSVTEPPPPSISLSVFSGMKECFCFCFPSLSVCTLCPFSVGCLVFALIKKRYYSRNVSHLFVIYEQTFFSMCLCLLTLLILFFFFWGGHQLGQKYSFVVKSATLSFYHI